MKTKRQILFRSLIIFYLTLASLFLFAQSKFTVSGEVKDKKTGETLIGVSIYPQEKITLGTVTNGYGFYSLVLPEGKYTLVFQYLGFEKTIIPVDLKENIKMDVTLTEISETLNEVVISAERKDKNVTSTQMSVTRLDVKEMNKVPVIFGERDILKTLQLLPGIKSAGEGNAGFYVRGGGADQNLILLDEAPVYNASHLLGFFSTFNSDAIKDVTIYKGGMPAEYGGRLSSVLDIKMNDGNSQKASVSGGIGLISSRLTVEAPIVKDRGSFMVSGRRTYADVFLKLSPDQELRGNKLYFYDLNLKGNYRISENDKVFLSGYFGRDNLGLGKAFGIAWGNATGTARWNHIFNQRLFSNTSFTFSNYDYSIKINSGDDFTIVSGIKDFNLKEDFQYSLNERNTLKFGFNAIYHTFIPGKISIEGKSAVNDLEIEKKHAFENALYLSNEQKIADHLKISYGLRYSMFTAVGPGSVYTYDDDGNATDTTVYSKRQIQKNYGGFEPRLSANYMINEKSSIKASYVRTYQYLHLLSNSSTSSPTDLWMPTSKLVKPEIADQVALGYFRNFQENAYETSVEIYYKGLKNQIDYKNGADILLNPNVESQLVFGKGWSYGAEFFIKKKYGKLNGWIGYTWSRTERKFDDINEGKKFLARQDRTHDISVVAMYDLTEKLNVSATWVYSTGNAVTFPAGGYKVDNQNVPLYIGRNDYRMPANHRMDIGVTWIRKKTEKMESSWNLSLYNAYGRENAYTIDFKQNEDNPEKTEAVQVSLFRWIPSITYNFKF